MTMPITALFGGLLVLLCSGMSLTLGLTRANNGVMFGSGGKVRFVVPFCSSPRPC